MTIPGNWKSRKWLIALVALVYGVIIHVFPSVSGKVAEEDLRAVLTILLTWLGVEGTADAISRWKGTGKK